MIKMHKRGKSCVVTHSEGVSQNIVDSVVDSIIDVFNKTGVQVYSFTDFSVKISNRIDGGYYLLFTR